MFVGCGKTLNYWKLSNRVSRGRENTGFGEFHMRQRAILAPFDGYSEILDTVVIFLANDLKVNDTAQELFLHPNTVRYRLGRAEKLIGGPLSSPLTLTDLTLALEAEIWAQRKKG